MADGNIAPIFGTVIYSYNGFGDITSLIDGRPANQAAIDLGDYTLYKADADNDWVIIDLGEARALTGFALWGGASTTGRCVKDYRIALDNDPSGSFANVVIDSQINETFYFGGKLSVHRDYQPIIPQSARYVKLFLDSNYGHISLEAMELEIIGPGIQQVVDTFTSNSEIYRSPETIAVTSDAYIVPAPIVIEIKTVTSNAEITGTRTDILSNVVMVTGNTLSSDSWITATDQIDVQSDAMVYRSGSAAREVFTMGKGSFTGFPEARSSLIYCTHISSSDEVIVADMITSSIMDITDITPPLGYQNYDWKYDWVVRTYDNAQYKFEIRTGGTVPDLLASTFSSIVLGQIISVSDGVPRYYQWRCHIWASGSGDFELHQFSIKGYINHPANLLYSSLNSGEFTTVSKVETGVTKPYEPMDMDKIWDGSYVPGDVDGDCIIDYNDILYLTAWLYSGGPAPNPIRRADVNDSDRVNISDITYLVAYLFGDGPPPYRWDESGLE